MRRGKGQKQADTTREGFMFIAISKVWLVLMDLLTDGAAAGCATFWLLGVEEKRSFQVGIFLKKGLLPVSLKEDSAK
jgi:hypothetical protein